MTTATASSVYTITVLSLLHVPALRHPQGALHQDLKLTTINRLQKQFRFYYVIFGANVKHAGFTYCDENSVFKV
jgi:hypothetical protein